MPKSYQKIVKKKNWPKNNRVTYFFFISNEFVDFLESILIFSMFFYVFENLFENIEK